MTRAQTVMDLLGSLHTLQLDSAWMMRLPVARKHLCGLFFLSFVLVPATCSSVSAWLEWLASVVWEVGRQEDTDRETILQSRL